MADDSEVLSFCLQDCSAYFSSTATLISLSPGGVSIPGCASRGVNFCNTSMPRMTSPKIVYWLLYCVVGSYVMKNWLPLVSGPELTMATMPGRSKVNEGSNSVAM